MESFQRAEETDTFPQLSAFAVTAIRDCLQAVDTVFWCRTECRQSRMAVEAIANKRKCIRFFVRLQNIFEYNRLCCCHFVEGT